MLKPIIEFLASLIEYFSTPVGFVGLATTVVAILASFIVPPIVRRRARVAITKERSKFPFDILTVEDLEKPEILARLHLHNSDIPHLQRLPPDEQAEMVDAWLEILNRSEDPHLLIKGVTGLGKTREAIEILRRLDQQPGQGPLTILMPRSDMDVPLEVPDDLNFRNIVLFLSDLHHKYQDASEEGLIHLLPQRVDFHSRLERVLDFFERQVEGEGPFRVIATVRSEPGLYDRINPEDDIWQGFSIQELPGLSSDQVPPVVGALSTHFEIQVNSGATWILQQRNDGTFQSLIYYLDFEKSLGRKSITEEMARLNFIGTYQDFLEKTVFGRLINPYPHRVVVLVALDLLSEAQVPLLEDVVIELSSRIWDTWQPLWWRRRKVRQGLQELTVWLQREAGVILCHETLFENRARLTDHIPIVISALLDSLGKSQELADKLFNPIISLASFLYTNRYYALALELYSMLVRYAPTSAIAHYSLSWALENSGYARKALEEIDAAIQLDPSRSDFHRARASLLHDLGDLQRSELSYAAALKMATRADRDVPWLLFGYAWLLRDLMDLDKTETCFREALDIDPSQVSVRAGLAEVLIEKGDMAQANEEASIAFATEPGSSADRANLADLYRRFGQPDRAIQMLTELLDELHGEISPLSLSRNTRLALSYLQAGNGSMAKQVARKSIAEARTLLERESNSIPVLHDLVIATLVIEDSNEARATVRELLSICPYNGVFINLAHDIRELISIGIAPEIPNTLLEFIELAISDWENPRRMRSEVILRDPHRPLASTFFGWIQRQARLRELADFRDQASALQEDLAANEILVDRANFRMVISGDQKIKELSIPEVSTDDAMDVLNEAIKSSQRLAARKLQEMAGGFSSLSALFAGSPDEASGPMSRLRQLKQLRDKALEVQEELAKEQIVVDRGNVRVVISGDQQVQVFEVEGEDQEIVIESLNEAIKAAQKLAAKKLQESGGFSSLLSQIGGGASDEDLHDDEGEDDNEREEDETDESDH